MILCEIEFGIITGGNYRNVGADKNIYSYLVKKEIGLCHSPFLIYNEDLRGWKTKMARIDV
jgi:hypothetical protein